MLRSLLLLSAVASLPAVLGCDLLFGPPAVIGGGERPAREGEDEESEGEGEEGEGEEGEEGEGEGDPDVPPDIRPDPQGPNIVSFDVSSTRLRDSDSATITVVVSDVDGADDIIGPLLIEPVSGTTLGPLTTAGAGTFTATINWNTWSSTDIVEFNRGADARFIRVQFSDTAGHQVTATQRIEVFCDADAPACDGSCGRVRCPGQGNQCLSTEGQAVDAAGLCGACNVECEACASGCACFAGAPRCSASDCLVTVNGEGQGTSQCTVNEGIRLRSDGFVVWDVANVETLSLLNFRFSLPSGEQTNTFYEALCADFGGLDFVNRLPAPPALRSSRTVVTVDPDCRSSNLGACQPVLGLSSQVNTDFQGDVVSCNQPLDGSQGTFGNPCFNGSCSDGSQCSSNLCVEFCSSDDECDACRAGGDSCVCDVANGLCEVGQPTGGFGEACNDNGSCDGGNLFCGGPEGCDESCSSSFDCVACNAAHDGACTCDTVSSGTCDPPRDGDEFACVTSSSREIASTGTFSGSTVGSTATRRGSCDGGSAPEQLWKFTAPSSSTFTFETSGFDTIVYLLSPDCAGSEQTCDDDDGVASGGSLVTIGLSAGDTIVVVVDGFGSASGSYTLSVSN